MAPFGTFCQFAFAMEHDLSKQDTYHFSQLFYFTGGYSRFEKLFWTRTNSLYIPDISSASSMNIQGTLQPVRKCHSCTSDKLMLKFLDHQNLRLKPSSWIIQWAIPKQSSNPMARSHLVLRIHQWGFLQTKMTAIQWTFPSLPAREEYVRTTWLILNVIHVWSTGQYLSLIIPSLLLERLEL